MPEPKRRVLALHRDKPSAVASTLGEQGWMRKASGVQVEHLGQRSPDPGRPRAVTATRTG
jgi:hypothetical protein